MKLLCRCCPETALHIRMFMRSSVDMSSAWADCRILTMRKRVRLHVCPVQIKSRHPLPVKAGMDPDICNPVLNKWPDNGCVMNVTMQQTRIAYHWKQSKVKVQREWPSLAALWGLMLPRDKTPDCSDFCPVSCISPSSRNPVWFTD